MVKLNHGVGTLPLSFGAFQKKIRQSGAVVQAQAAKRQKELKNWLDGPVPGWICHS